MEVTSGLLGLHATRTCPHTLRPLDDVHYGSFLLFVLPCSNGLRYTIRKSQQTASSQNLPPCRPNSFAIYLLKPLFENIICSPVLLMILLGKKKAWPPQHYYVFIPVLCSFLLENSSMHLPVSSSSSYESFKDTSNSLASSPVKSRL